MTLLLEVSYFLAMISFIVGLKFLSSPQLAKLGNIIAGAGMTLAIIVTVIHTFYGGPVTINLILIIVAVLLGTVLGKRMSDKAEMTRMPQLVSYFNAMGGGCELAMMTDFIICADTAKFGQPEINLGIIAGMGGTQRLTRAVGKAKSMEMHLTGRFMDAVEAERAGLVARIVPAADLLDDALKTAAKIAAKSQIAVKAAKEAVNRAQETTLREGLLLERRLFHAMFATEDQKEGMAAFVEKRPANFKDC